MSEREVWVVERQNLNGAWEPWVVERLEADALKFCAECGPHYHAMPYIPAAPVTDMRVCEIAHLVLHPGQLYRFSVDENCEACRAYFGQPAPAEADEGDPRIFSREQLRTPQQRADEGLRERCKRWLDEKSDALRIFGPDTLASFVAHELTRARKEWEMKYRDNVSAALAETEHALADASNAQDSLMLAAEKLRVAVEAIKQAWWRE